MLFHGSPSPRSTAEDGPEVPSSSEKACGEKGGDGKPDQETGAESQFPDGGVKAAIGAWM